MSDLTWSGDTLTLPDGTVFAIFSEAVRGEGRFYNVEYQTPAGRAWHGIDEDGSYDRRTAVRRAERAARAWLAEHPEPTTWVWVMPESVVYHTDRECSALHRWNRYYPIGEPWPIEKVGGRRRPCKLCNG